MRRPLSPTLPAAPGHRPLGLALGALLAAAPPAPAQELPLPPVPRLAPESVDPAVADRLDRLDPSDDEWVGEVWNSAAGHVLHRLEDVLAGKPDDLEDCVAPTFPALDLRPPVVPAERTPSFQVLRPSADRPAADASPRPAPTPPPAPTPVSGAEALRRALADLAEPFGGRPFEVHFKVLSTVPAEGAVGGFRTRVRYEAGHRTHQQRARWTCTWRERPHGGEAAAGAELVTIEVEEHEEVARTAEGALFSDCTEALFAAAPAWRTQLLPGLPHWRARLDSALGVSLLGHQGIAVGDANADGREDLFVCQPGGLPNLLFLRGEAGALREDAAGAGLDFLDPSRCALWLDLDEDGDRDLALAFFHTLVLLENDGQGRFASRAELAADTATSLAAADYDLDGDLDLYVCSYVAPYDDSVTPTPYHDANNGQANALFRNDGEWRFADVTEEVGLDANNRRFSFAAAWEDVDNDGDSDLYVANDFGRNNLYRNDGGRFVDVAPAAGVEDVSAGMGVTFADVDHDGWMDVYVSNMFSSAGSRVTYTRRFQPSASETELAQYRRHARGNSLFLAAGDGTYRDASVEAGVTMGRWSWGSLFTDFDNDGWEDLVVPNGFVTGRERLDDL